MLGSTNIYSILWGAQQQVMDWCFPKTREQQLRQSMLEVQQDGLEVQKNRISSDIAHFIEKGTGNERIDREINELSLVILKHVKNLVRNKTITIPNALPIEQSIQSALDILIGKIRKKLRGMSQEQYIEKIEKLSGWINRVLIAFQEGEQTADRLANILVASLESKENLGDSLDELFIAIQEQFTVNFLDNMKAATLLTAFNFLLRHVAQGKLKWELYKIIEEIEDNKELYSEQAVHTLTDLVHTYARIPQDQARPGQNNVAPHQEQSSAVDPADLRKYQHLAKNVDDILKIFLGSIAKKEAISLVKKVVHPTWLMKCTWECISDVPCCRKKITKEIDKRANQAIQMGQDWITNMLISTLHSQISKITNKEEIDAIILSVLDTLLSALDSQEDADRPENLLQAKQKNARQKDVRPRDVRPRDARQRDARQEDRPENLLQARQTLTESLQERFSNLPIELIEQQLQTTFSNKRIDGCLSNTVKGYVTQFTSFPQRLEDIFKNLSKNQEDVRKRRETGEIGELESTRLSICNLVKANFLAGYWFLPIIKPDSRMRNNVFTTWPVEIFCLTSSAISRVQASCHRARSRVTSSEDSHHQETIPHVVDAGGVELIAGGGGGRRVPPVLPEWMNRLKEEGGEHLVERIDATLTASLYLATDRKTVEKLATAALLCFASEIKSL